MGSESLLSPDESPKRAHVRRLNHIPLYFIGVLAAIVLVLLVMVGVERSKPLAGLVEDHGPAADAYARQIAGDRVGYIPAPKPSPVRLSLPVPVATPSPTPWQRIIYPNGDALDIGAMPGVDAVGEAGFHDKVNNHFLRIFGSALLMSAFTAGVTLSQPNQNINSAPNAESTLSAALGQQLGQATSALLERNLSIPPTLTIRQGYAFNIVVVKDLTFDRPYVAPNY